MALSMHVLRQNSRFEGRYCWFKDKARMERKCSPAGTYSHRLNHSEIGPLRDKKGGLFHVKQAPGRLVSCA